jgi:hypothetical protein
MLNRDPESVMAQDKLISHDASVYVPTVGQFRAALVSFLFAVIGAGLVSAWVSGEDTDQGYNGGANWEDKIYGYHPLLMTLGFGLLALSGILIPILNSGLHFLQNKPYVKYLHGLCHTGALICISLGLYAIVATKNGQNAAKVSHSNLMTPHSWMGMIAILTYFQNYLGGVWTFLLWNLFGSADELVKKAYLSIHRTCGLVSLMASLAALVSGMQNGSACGADYDKNIGKYGSYYPQLNTGCRLLNGSIVVFFLSFALAIYALLPQLKVDNHHK